jgi:DNA-binding LacI/PurR family transcriptional regulator
MANLTIKDIARMAGVSTTAVSFVLNNRPGVSEATRQKVQEIIRQTDFIPNVHTRRLNLGKSFTIHVVLKQYAYGLYNQFALETLSGVFKEGKSLGYSIIFTLVEEDVACEQLIESVRSKDCDGIILNQIDDPGLLNQLQKENIPVVCVDAHLPATSGLPMVEVDYYDAAYQAARYLHQNGHTNIGFIGPQTPAEHCANTFRGFTDYLKEMELSCNPDWVAKIPFSQVSTEAAVDKMLEHGTLPTALLCSCDAVAIDVIRRLKERNIRIPEDISVVGIDDLLVSRYLDPALSTMTFDKELLGAKAMELLYQIIQGAAYVSRNTIGTTVVERGSVKTME